MLKLPTLPQLSSANGGLDRTASAVDPFQPLLWVDGWPVHARMQRTHIAHCVHARAKGGQGAQHLVHIRAWQAHTHAHAYAHRKARRTHSQQRQHARTLRTMCRCTQAATRAHA